MNVQKNHPQKIVIVWTLALIVLFGGVNAAKAQWTTNGNNVTNTNSGNVGIGTTSPAAKLDVSQNFRLGSDGTSNVTNAYPSITSSGTNYYKALDINAYQLPISSGVTESGYRIGMGVQGFVSDVNFAGTLVYQYGIWARHGSNVASSGSRINNSYGIYIDSLTTTNTTIDNLYGLYQSSSAAKNYFAGNVAIGIAPNASRGFVVKAPDSTNIPIEGIESSGVHSIYLRPHVSSGVNLISSNYWSGGTYLPLSLSGRENISDFVLNAGNVGIGTASPPAKLSVYAGASALIGQWDTTNSTGGYVQYSNSGTVIGYLGSAGQLVSPAGSPSDFSIDSPNALVLGAGNQNRVYIASSGNVGIGKTPDASYKLDVNGTISGNNVIAKYQDVAEWVPSSEQLSAGTVVVLDATKSNQVTSSSVSYDTRVAGVVSDQPGIALGEKSDGKVLVATTGRVRVKVDATKNPIRIGDLLVTGNVPGMAMKSEPIIIGGRQIHAPGTLIGKALEPLEKGKGEILVLLSLQ